MEEARETIRVGIEIEIEIGIGMERETVDAQKRVVAGSVSVCVGEGLGCVLVIT